MDEKKIHVIGITGRSGSGKSSVTSYYALQGSATADGDEISRHVMQPGSACVDALKERYGKEIIDADGRLLRRRLAEIAFAQPDGGRELAKITHPFILQEFLKRVEAARQQGHRLFFIDGAMIVGGIFQPHCEKLIVVTAEQRLSVSRIVLRDGISKTAALKRLEAQPAEEELCAVADYVLHNNGSEAQLREKADEVLKSIRQTLLA